MRILLIILKPVVNILGLCKRWYLSLVYLPMVRQGGDIGAINTLLTNSNRRNTDLILREMGANISPTAYIENHLIIHNARQDYSNLTVGPKAYIGKDCLIDLSAPVEICANATVAMRVTLLTHFNGGFSKIAKQKLEEVKPVCIREGAYIGAGAIVMPGVTIGEGAIVAAGAVVISSVNQNTIVKGIPAG